jgi:iron complex outermembrane receptor protein
VGLYTDLEADVLDPLLVNVAGRFENYSDFGSTLNGKVALRFEPIRQFIVRGTAQTGFRAPNQAQKFFSKVSTTFIDNRPFQTGIFPVNSPVGNALGVPDLEEETSVNLSGGVVLKPIERFQITADYFNIRIDDRIILSGDLTGDAVEQALQGTGATVASVFTNAIDTETQGVDVTAKYAAILTDGVQLQLRGAFNWTENEIVGGPRNPTTIDEVFGEEIFGREARLELTEQFPSTTAKLSATLTAGPVDVTLRGARHGEYLSPDDEPGDDEYTLGAEYVFGGEIGARFLNDQLNVALGARNLFDNYPDLDPVQDTFDIILPYDTASPIGFNGRFVYSRLTVTL